MAASAIAGAAIGIGEITAQGMAVTAVQEAQAFWNMVVSSKKIANQLINAGLS